MPRSIDPDRNDDYSTKNLDQWLFEVKTEMQKLREELNETKTENSKLIARIESLDKSKATLGGNENMTNERAWASIISGKKPSHNEQLYLGLVNREMQQKARIENNILITGIKEDSSDANADSTMVNKVLNALEIEPETVKTKRRIKRKFTTDRSGNALKPYELIVVEFKDQSTQNKALLNSKKLKDVEGLKNIYINPEKTDSERQLEREKRLERNKRNDLLTHQVKEDPRQRYNIKQDGTMYYWGIRNGEFRKMSFSLPEGTTGEPRPGKGTGTSEQNNNC